MRQALRDVDAKFKLQVQKDKEKADLQLMEDDLTVLGEKILWRANYYRELNRAPPKQVRRVHWDKFAKKIIVYWETESENERLYHYDIGSGTFRDEEKRQHRAKLRRIEQKR